MKQDAKVVIYRAEDGKTQLDVQLKEETVWLNQRNMAELFETTPQNITIHLRNIFKEGELIEKSTCKDFLQVQIEGGRKIKRSQKFYNLDVIISVGYRIRSKRATQFRIWASRILKNYLVKGYALNQKRLTEKTAQLAEINSNLRLMGRIIRQKQLSYKENEAFLNLIGDYAFALDLLDKYDHQNLEEPKEKTNSIYRITIDDALEALHKLKSKAGGSTLFAKPKDKSFESSLTTIHQTFDSKELYPSLEDKAAHLLYFVVKNHSFVDGNKRIGAFLFVWFLQRNNALLDVNGLQRMNNETLIALTILVAESKPDEKSMIIKLIKHLLATGK